jgi:hypothetical protein
MITDNRALASGLIGFVVIIVFAGILYVFLAEPMSSVFAAGSAQATSQQARDAIALREQIWNNILYFVMFLAGVFVISRAVFESRRGA